METLRIAVNAISNLSRHVELYSGVNIDYRYAARSPQQTSTPAGTLYAEVSPVFPPATFVLPA